jgi:hypothetical protein
MTRVDACVILGSWGFVLVCGLLWMLVLGCVHYSTRTCALLLWDGDMRQGQSDSFLMKRGMHGAGPCMRIECVCLG